MSISNQFFCNSCKTSNGAPGTTQAACDGLMKIAGTKCLEYNPDGFDSIANEINDVWKTVMPDLKSRNKLNKNHFSDNAGKLMVMGEKEDMIEDTKFEIIKKHNSSDNTFDWFFEENGNEKSYTKDYLKSNPTKLDEQKEMKSISDKIEEKLRDIYFYTVSEKGKERVRFDLEDKRNIEQHLKDLYNQNITGDRGFIMAVVRAKGSDKEDGQLIKLGSYPKDSNIDLGFEEKGLGGLIGTQYFSIKNNDGPDDRDFEIVKGDINKDIEFKKEIEVEEPKEVMNQPVKEEPYEEVMKQRELKGLASLVNSDEVGGDFTKKQKEILEKLKSQGYLFKRPVEDSNYKKTKVNSSEFTESFHVWKKQD